MRFQFCIKPSPHARYGLGRPKTRDSGQQWGGYGIRAIEDQFPRGGMYGGRRRKCRWKVRVIHSFLSLRYGTRSTPLRCNDPTPDPLPSDDYIWRGEQSALNSILPIPPHGGVCGVGNGEGRGWGWSINRTFVRKSSGEQAHEEE